MAVAICGSLTTITMALYPSGVANADRAREAQWHLRYLDLNKAHQITKGSGVAVAVLDTGTFPHTDLKNNLQKGTDTVPGGDGTGRVDNEGHGTQMSGIIGGHGHGSNSGVIGIAPEAGIIPIKAAGGRDNGAGLEAGLKWAAKAGAKVINVSASTIPSRNLNAAVNEAISADAVIVAGSGNKSDNLLFSYPAAIPEVLAVGAVGKNGKLTNFSITGPQIDICAPGVDIVSTDRGNKYYKGSGTSEATAVVSGAAALVRAKFPGLSAREVVHRLTATADDNGPAGKDDQCGYGVLNIVKALTADVPPLVSEGSAGASVSASAGVSPSGEVGASGPSDEARGESAPSGSSMSAVAGVGAAVIALGGLIALLVARRRRSKP